MNWAVRLALSALTAVTMALSAESAVWNVRSEGMLESIGAAVQTATAGDTIVVEAGHYRESGLIIDKPLTLMGQNWPVVDAESKAGIFEIKAHDVTISGFLFRNVPVSHIKEHAAIQVSYTSNCEIRDNRFENNFFAISVAKSDHCRIIRNEIHGSSKDLTTAGNGVHLWNCRDIAVQGNTIQGHRDGIYLEFVKHSTISENRSEGNLRYGLHFMFSDSCSYEKNQFVRNGSGVAVMYTTQVHMEDNRFAGSWGGAAYGLLLKDIRNSRVVRNTFSGNSVGIHMEGSDRITVEENLFVENGWAVKIMANCVNSAFRNNSFIDNSFQVATNSRQSFSTFEGNFWSSYRGFDLDRDGYGDDPYRPVSLYSLLVESDPATLVLVRSLLVEVLNLAERIVPTLTPETLVDNRPRMRPTI